MHTTEIQQHTPYVQIDAAKVAQLRDRHGWIVEPIIVLVMPF